METISAVYPWWTKHESSKSIIHVFRFLISATQFVWQAALQAVGHIDTMDTLPYDPMSPISKMPELSTAGEMDTGEEEGGRGRRCNNWWGGRRGHDGPPPWSNYHHGWWGVNPLPAEVQTAPVSAKGFSGSLPWQITLKSMPTCIRKVELRWVRQGLSACRLMRLIVAIKIPKAMKIGRQKMKSHLEHRFMMRYRKSWILRMKMGQQNKRKPTKEFSRWGMGYDIFFSEHFSWNTLALLQHSQRIWVPYPTTFCINYGVVFHMYMHMHHIHASIYVTMYYIYIYACT